MTKFVYSFNEGSRDMKDILGSKGANLAEMTGIGLPVPFGFTISTEACRRYFEENHCLGKDLEEAIYEKITELENVTGKGFGSAGNPLLVSVRSGAEVSMPGMMDTILNLGLNDETTEGLAALTGSRRFAFDSYRRFIQIFGSVALGIPKAAFQDILCGQIKTAGVQTDLDLSEQDLEAVVAQYKELVKETSGKDFPQDPAVQLTAAVKAVFNSWNNDRASEYRKLHHIPENMGTAVNVQAMVFGNLGDNSGTGVAFTRDPATGEKKLSGKFLVNAQGEDVNAEIRRPVEISGMEEIFPDCCKVLSRISELLEKHYKDMQDMEFTIENNKLYMLQTRTGRREARAAVKMAVDMAEEGLIDKETAILRVKPEQIGEILESGTCYETLGTLMEWADDIRELKIRANAENPMEAALALRYGADGIGLCRTEHMFFSEERLPAFRRMILADTSEEKAAALEILKPFQQSDFKEIYKSMGERPVTIRLLDPALHQFLPHDNEEIAQVAEELGMSVEMVAAKTEELREANPLLGSRGCRLAIVTPEIAKMQTEAIICAALEVKQEDEVEPSPEIMIPLVGTAAELAAVRKVVEETADRCIAESGIALEYSVGTMIETPRAALTADEIAEEAEFFSFGTNDLTQMTFGFSQADTRELIGEYVKKGLLKADPFRTLDQEGVGRLLKTACDLGRHVKPRLRIGICGEHGGDPASIEFCHKAGMNYVSCPPAKVPVAKLAAARAAVISEENEE